MTNPVVTLVGNVVKAPEVRFTAGGKAWASMTIVTKDRVEVNGEWQDKNPTFYGVTCWEQQAEMLAESDLQPGNEVIVVGKLHQREYETAEGEKRRVLDVNAYQVGVSITKRVSVRVVKVDREAAPAGGSDPWATPPGVDPFTAPHDDTPPF